MIVISGLDLYIVFDYLFCYFLDFEKGFLYVVEVILWQDVVNIDKFCWDWFEEKVKVGDFKVFCENGINGVISFYFGFFGNIL